MDQPYSPSPHGVLAGNLWIRRRSDQHFKVLPLATIVRCRFRFVGSVDALRVQRVLKRLVNLRLHCNALIQKTLCFYFSSQN
jgi:hypothetical protein